MLRLLLFTLFAGLGLAGALLVVAPSRVARVVCRVSIFREVFKSPGGQVLLPEWRLRVIGVGWVTASGLLLYHLPRW